VTGFFETLDALLRCLSIPHDQCVSMATVLWPDLSWTRSVGRPMSADGAALSSLHSVRRRRWVVSQGGG
jgi:hypothetical protein